MKRVYLTFALLMVAMFMQAQDKTAKPYEREGKVFVRTTSQVLPSDQVTAYLWRDTNGNEYPIILHTYTKGDKAGRTTAYVIRRSEKSGKEYRYFIPNGEEIAKEILNENR